MQWSFTIPVFRQPWESRQLVWFELLDNVCFFFSWRDRPSMSSEGCWAGSFSFRLSGEGIVEELSSCPFLPCHIILVWANPVFSKEATSIYFEMVFLLTLPDWNPRPLTLRASILALGYWVVSALEHFVRPYRIDNWALCFMVTTDKSISNMSTVWKIWIYSCSGTLNR